MDRIDSEIVRLLLQNARISMSEISSCVNLSVSAVSERLKKLESSGMIQQYTAILNPQAFNKDLTVFMLITLESSQFRDEFVHYVLNEEAITEVHYLAGSFDCMVKIITENTTSLEKIFNQIKSLPGVSKTQTNVGLSTIKNQYSFLPSLDSSL